MKIVIVGGVAGGATAAARIRRLDEQAEIIEMSKLVKQAIAKLPQKERTVVEYRFYRNMQAKDIAVAVGLSPSRITRIIQFALNQIREYLKSRGRVDY